MEIGSYTGLPKKVFAIQIDGVKHDGKEIVAVLKKWMPGIQLRTKCLPHPGKLYLAVHGQWHQVFNGDWIIRGIEGEYYPCTDSIFKKSYRKLQDHALVRKLREPVFLSMEAERKQGMTFKAIGEKWGYSANRIVQILERRRRLRRDGKIK